MFALDKSILSPSRPTQDTYHLGTLIATRTKLLALIFQT